MFDNLCSAAYAAVSAISSELPPATRVGANLGRGLTHTWVGLRPGRHLFRRLAVVEVILPAMRRQAWFRIQEGRGILAIEDPERRVVVPNGTEILCAGILHPRLFEAGVEDAVLDLLGRMPGWVRDWKAARDAGRPARFGEYLGVGVPWVLQSLPDGRHMAAQGRENSIQAGWDPAWLAAEGLTTRRGPGRARVGREVTA